MKKHRLEANKHSASKQRDDFLSTLAERVREKNPELMKKIEGFRRAEDPVKRVVQVLNDLFPYRWVDGAAFAEAVKLSVQGNYQDAINLLSEVLRYDPGAYPAHHLAGYWFGCLGDGKQEIDYYKKAIKLNPACPQVYYDLGVSYATQGREKKAFTAFKQTVPLAPEFAVADYWFTFSFDRLGRYRDSGRAGDKDLNRRDPVLAQACWMLGNAFVEYRLYAAARNAFKRAIRTQLDFAEAYYQLGELHIKKLRNPQRAAKYLGEAEQLFLKQGNFHRAAFAHQLLHPKDEVSDRDAVGETWLKEGLRLQLIGRYQSAVDAYKVALAFKPKYLEALYNMGIAYGCLADQRTTGRLPDQRDAGPKSPGLDGSQPLSIPPSVAAEMGEEIQRAIWAFKDSIRIKPDFIHAYIGMGASYIKSNRLEEAISVLQEACKLEPPDATIYYYLGMVYRMSGKYAEAVNDLKKAIAIEQDSEQVHFYLGLVYLDLQQHENACASFEEAVRVKPDFADGHYMLGDLFGSKICDSEKAVSHLKKAEKLYIKLEDYDQSARVRQMLMQFPG